MNETKVKCFFKEPMHVRMYVKKVSKRGREYATPKKTNPIQGGYPTSVPLLGKQERWCLSGFNEIIFHHIIAIPLNYNWADDDIYAAVSIIKNYVLICSLHCS